jgi:hypothetical protein
MSDPASEFDYSNRQVNGHHSLAPRAKTFKVMDRHNGDNQIDRESMRRARP